MAQSKFFNKCSLIPPYLINGVLFTLTFLIVVSYGAIESIWIPIFIAFAYYLTQILLFSKFDQKSFLICVPLSIYALLFGWIQEIAFIELDILSYANKSLSPPFWMLLLYPIFALTLNSSLSFLNKNLYLTFFLGGFFANLGYLSIEKLNGVVITAPQAFPIIFILSGLCLILLILLNHKLILLKEKYTDPKQIKKILTVFFDKRCSFCSHQMEALQHRNQTGEVVYACPSADEDLSEVTNAFTYKEAMETIHAIDEDNKVLTGTATISALFARTDLPWIAIFLQAPGFSYLFEVGYAISAKLRRRI